MRLFLIGDRVSQQQYGPGTVAAANEYHTTVDFDEHGSRTFATSIVKLAFFMSTALTVPAIASFGISNFLSLPPPPASLARATMTKNRLARQRWPARPRPPRLVSTSLRSSRGEHRDGGRRRKGGEAPLRGS